MFVDRVRETLSEIGGFPDDLAESVCGILAERSPDLLTTFRGIVDGPDGGDRAYSMFQVVFIEREEEDDGEEDDQQVPASMDELIFREEPEVLVSIVRTMDDVWRDGKEMAVKVANMTSISWAAA